jgi:hypothetical protein
MPEGTFMPMVNSAFVTCDMSPQYLCSANTHAMFTSASTYPITFTVDIVQPILDSRQLSVDTLHRRPIFVVDEVAAARAVLPVTTRIVTQAPKHVGEVVIYSEVALTIFALTPLGRAVIAVPAVAPEAKI